MKKNSGRGIRKFSGIVITALSLTGIIVPLNSAAAEELTLSVNEAVNRALSSDQRIRSSYLQLQSALLHIDETRKGRYPSLALDAGYTRLSHVSSTVDLGPASFDIESQDDLFSMSARMGYALFAGFRGRETENLARLQARGREISFRQMKQAVMFETRRAYWEAVRMQNNVSMLNENLSISIQNRDITRNKFNGGTVLKADLLAAEMRCEQAQMDLEGAELYRDRAFLNLFTLVEALDAGIPESPLSINFESDPAVPPMEILPGEKELLGKALIQRPESLSASTAVELGEAGESLLKTALSPTLSVSGNYTFANPNSRVFLQSDPQFTGTWALGLSLSYELGQIPSRLSAIASKEAEIESLKAEKQSQDESIAREIRNCLLVYRQTEKDITHVSDMLLQARENERVTAQRVKTGTASDVDQLSASLVRLQGEFAIINKQIDLQIAAADLLRAAALESSGE